MQESIGTKGPVYKQVLSIPFPRKTNWAVTSLPAFERHLLAQGYGIYSIDYTQDSSGVPDREGLERYLCSEGFRTQGDFVYAMQAKNPPILANTDSIGKLVSSWICGNKSGRAVRTRMHNKILSNVEAGGNSENQCEGIWSIAPKKFLRKTFLHPDLQKRCCTHIGVSLYACNEDDLSTQKASEEIQNALCRRLSPGGSKTKAKVVCLLYNHPANSGKTSPNASTAA